MKIQKLLPLFLFVMTFSQIHSQSTPVLNENYILDDTKSNIYSVVGDSLKGWSYYSQINLMCDPTNKNGNGELFHCGADKFSEDWNWRYSPDENGNFPDNERRDDDLNKPTYSGFAKAIVLSTTSKDTVNGYTYGNSVVLRSLINPNYALYYAHFNSISVSKGDIVYPGTEIGKIGKTGPVLWEHLHLTLYKNLDDAAIARLSLGKPPSAIGDSIPASKYAADFDVSVPIKNFNLDHVRDEPNNTFSAATFISQFYNKDVQGKSVQGFIKNSEEDIDFYWVSIASQGNLTVTISDPSSNLELLDVTNQTLVTALESSNGSKTLNYCFSENTNSCNQFFIKVSTLSKLNSDSPYDLQLDWDYNNGCTTSKSDNNFYKTTNSDLTITGDSEICEGENTSLSVTGGSGNYIWFANGNEIGTGSSITVSNLPQGQNQITVVDIDNPCSSGGSIVVYVNEGITANAGNDVAIQDGGYTQLQGSGGSTYSWSPSQGLSNSNISNPIASPTQTTTYTLTATENGCTDTDSVTITVSPNNYADVIVDNIWTVPSNPKVGEQVDLYVQVKNTGTEKAYSLNWNYLINTNIVGSDNHYALEPNETRVEYFNNYTFSSSSTFNFCVDIEVEPNEQNTSNNNYCKQISVGDFPPEDTVVTNISVSSSNLNAGDNLTVSADQYYSGGRTVSELPAIKLGYYLSLDCNFSADDVLLAEDSSSIGSDNTFESETAVVTIPTSTEGGSYFIVFASDHTNIINESDDNNNTLCHHITVSNPNSQTIDAGILNPPVNGLIIHEDNRDTYVLTSDLDKIRIDGWSNTGKISNIQIYKMKGNTPDPDNDTRLYYAENANGGSWWKDADVGAGEHTIYINVKCNYIGCLFVGNNSETRKFTYVKPYRAGHFYIPNSNEEDVRIVILKNYGSSSETGFYYRLYRNTSASLSGGTYIGNWSQDGEFTDTNTEPNQTYYYWVDVAMNSHGSYNSGITASEYRTITTLDQTDLITPISTNMMWSEAEKWDMGVVPDENTNVYIPNAMSVTMDMAGKAKKLSVANGGKLEVLPKKSLSLEEIETADSGEVFINSDDTGSGTLIVTKESTGKVTYNRYLTTDWHLIGAPVKGQMMEGIFGRLATGSDGLRKGLSTYNNDLGKWDYFNEDSVGEIVSGTGYSTKVITEGSLPLKGNVLSYKEVETPINNGVKNSYNLVGNPYSAYIALGIGTSKTETNTSTSTENFFNVNLNVLEDLTVYVWDQNNGYQIINEAKALVNGGYFIAPGQGFFVNSNETGGNIKFTPQMLTHQKDIERVFYKNEQNKISYIKLTANNGKTESSTEIFDIVTATKGYDNGYDSRTFDVEEKEVEIYSLINNDENNYRYAIQSAPLENAIIPLEVKSKVGDKASISIDISNFKKDLKILFIDKENGNSTYLNNQNLTYEFSMGTKGTNKFEVHFEKSTLNHESNLLEKGVKVYQKGKQLLNIIGVRDNLKVSAEIYNLIGARVFNTSFEGNGNNFIKIPDLPTSIYIINLKSEEGVYRNKLLIE
jgi:hypothetical protein